ncbi:hypothetical protein AFERRI_530150 [Acidithiobacillus ferrivorans]|uniref:Uncharacterized protein n=1 Tax=Acidithiobacillus ferrivorans TaxID=160808 RepID=A0A060US48_9PROT|nr:hypothetical protein AFERRI_530150 [Acidithiobacillus ferrivorans]
MELWAERPDSIQNRLLQVLVKLLQRGWGQFAGLSAMLKRPGMTRHGLAVQIIGLYAFRNGYAKDAACWGWYCRHKWLVERIKDITHSCTP